VEKHEHFNYLRVIGCQLDSCENKKNWRGHVTSLWSWMCITTHHAASRSWFVSNNYPFL